MRKRKRDIFPRSSVINVVPDNDSEGMKHATELAMYQGFAQAQPVPRGKDLTEYCQQGGNVLDYLQGELARLPGGAG